jgi:hypothetical protein
MNPAYLQNFGKLHKDMRKREVSDTMSASGRWDDLYLRASKPYLAKTTRRESMRRDTKVYVAKGSRPIPMIPNGEVTTLLGFTSDPAKVKYKLDSPSYPSRSRALSHEVRKPQVFTKMVATDWKEVYASLRSMAHKIRMRDRALTRQLVKDFALLWPIRHTLAKSIDKRVEENRAIGFTSEMQISKPKAIPKVTIEVKAKVKPRKVAKVVLEEFKKNQLLLLELHKCPRLATYSWHQSILHILRKVKPEKMNEAVESLRLSVLRRQKALLLIIEGGK